MRQLDEIAYVGSPLTPFDQTNIVPVHPGTLGECLLREPLFQSKSAYRSTETSNDGILNHVLHTFGLYTLDVYTQNV